MPPTRPRPLMALALALLLIGCGAEAPDPVGGPAPEAEASAATSAGEAGPAVAGQTLYVPVYSHIFFRDAGRDIDLAVTLSVRNTDPSGSLTVTAVDYYDSEGRLVRRYLEEPVRFGPLASRAYVVAERDRTGGVGANFLVRWEASAPVSAPVVEAVMIGTASAQGISFVSRAVPVAPMDDAPPGAE